MLLGIIKMDKKFTIRFDGGKGVVKTWEPTTERTTVDKLTTAQQKAVAAAMAEYEKMLAARRFLPGTTR